MDNKNDIERNRQLRRIGDALEKIARNMQKPAKKMVLNSNGAEVIYGDMEKLKDTPHDDVMTAWYEHEWEDDLKGTIGDTIHDR